MPVTRPAPRAAARGATLVALAAVLLVAGPGCKSCARPQVAPAVVPPTLYWLVPCGLRADPDLFTVYKWAEEGKLPNLKRLMAQGAHGYSIADFPSHTPTNFATLMTGAHPHVHGVSDGPMHSEGAPLAIPSVKGFSSSAKRVDPVWKTLEDAGKRVALLSLPGSTPPEIQRGIVVRGRWGGWGADTPAVIFEPLELMPRRREAGRAFKLFFLGQHLTEFVETVTLREPRGAPTSFSPPRRAVLAAYGAPITATMVDTKDDRVVGYDRVVFQDAGGRDLATLAQGEQSRWLPVTLAWEGQTFPSQVRIRLIKLWPDSGHFRIRFFFDNANRFNTIPPLVAEELTHAAGPMVDFVDNWPGQLVYEPEDEAAFRDEARDSLAWHRRAAAHILDAYKPDAFIHNTYTPNQMLEARWWFRHLDRGRPGYQPARAAAATAELLAMYQGIDAILGEAMKRAGPNTIVALSSDHGIAQLRRHVRLNNLFARKGWLKFTIDEKTGEPSIDWAKSTVVYLKMAWVYVSPTGLAGPWRRASGPAYEKLRTEVRAALEELRDADGGKPLVRTVPWEQATAALKLPPDRVGDLVLEAREGYQWFEEITADQVLFSEPRGSGYKQAIDPTLKSMWTPFAIMGPGIKPGVTLARPISHADQLPTLLTLLGVKVPPHVQGRVLREIMTVAPTPGPGAAPGGR